MGAPIIKEGMRFGRLIISSWLGEQVTPQPPPMRGPYQKRRLKRWYKAHPPYTRGTGQFWIANGRTVWCHPDDYYKLKAAIDERDATWNAVVRPADKEA